MRWIESALIISLFSCSANAEGLTLAEAIEQATGSPRIEKAKAASEEASWRRVEAYSGFLPSLTGGITYLTDYKYAYIDFKLAPNPATLTIPQIMPTTDYSLHLSLPLFDGFASSERLAAAQLSESAAKKEFNWAQFQTERDVVLQFYRALAAKVLKEVADENLKTLEGHLKDVELFRKSGASTNYDVLRVDVQVSSARSEVLNATDNAEIAKSHLAEIIGLDGTRDVTGKLPVLDQNLIKGIQEDSVEGRTDLIALKEREQSLQKQETASGRYWAPKVSLFGGYDYYNNRNDSYNDWDKFRNSYDIGLNLTWNFFDGMTSISHSHQSIQQRIQAEKSVRMAGLHAHQEFQVWKRKFNYFCQVYRSRLTDIEKSREAVRLAREGRRVGARTNTDLLDAETDLHRSQADAVNAQIGAIEALINLEMASGQPLYKFN